MTRRIGTKSIAGFGTNPLRSQKLRHQQTPNLRTLKPPKAGRPAQPQKKPTPMAHETLAPVVVAAAVAVDAAAIVAAAATLQAVIPATSPTQTTTPMSQPPSMISARSSSKKIMKTSSASPPEVPALSVDLKNLGSRWSTTLTAMTMKHMKPPSRQRRPNVQIAVAAGAGAEEAVIADRIEKKLARNAPNP